MAIAHPRPQAAAPGLDPALQYDPGPHRDDRRNPALRRGRLQDLRLGPMSEPRGDAVAATSTSNTTNPRRTPGSTRSQYIGNASSTGKTQPRRHDTTEHLHAKSSPAPRYGIGNPATEEHVEAAGTRLSSEGRPSLDPALEKEAPQDLDVLVSHGSDATSAPTSATEIPTGLAMGRR